MERHITLYDGVKVGERTVHDIVMRPPTAGDLIDAQEAAERPVPTPDGWQLLASDSRMSVETLRRQIKRIGDDSGPMDMVMLHKMSAADLELLHQNASEMDATIAEEMRRRGRTDGAGTDDATG